MRNASISCRYTQVGLQIQALSLQTVIELAHAFVDAVFKHGFRDIRLERVGQLIEQLRLKRILSRMLALMLEFGLQIGFQLLQRVELAGVLGQIVVKLRQLLLLDLVQLALEGGGLPGQVLGVIILREGDLDLKFLVRRLAFDLLLKARDKLMGAEGQGVVLRLAARQTLRRRHTRRNQR